MREHSIRDSSRTDAILAWLHGRKEEMAAFLAELVAIPTENPPGTGYTACADLLETHIRQLNLDCDRFAPVGLAVENDQPPVSLLASLGSGERSLYFHGHYDVVPAQSVEQFQPTRKENFIFGRGSCDMKGGIVAMLYAILAIKEYGQNLNGKVSLMLVPDEETGGKRGSAWLASKGLLGRNGIGIYRHCSQEQP
jgi:succinyl-diaminopimelate desuccinylase